VSTLIEFEEHARDVLHRRLAAMVVFFLDASVLALDLLLLDDDPRAVREFCRRVMDTGFYLALATRQVPKRILSEFQPQAMPLVLRLKEHHDSMGALLEELAHGRRRL
jgi:hypothetical protein